MSLTSKLTAILDANEQSVGDLSTTTIHHRLAIVDSVASGTGSAMADTAWSDTRALAGVSELLDLNGGVMTVTKVKAILIENNSVTAGFDIAVGGGATPFSAFLGDPTDIVNVPAGGFFFIYDPAGWACGAGTTDKLKVNAGVNSVNYDIAILGVA